MTLSHRYELIKQLKALEKVAYANQLECAERHNDDAFLRTCQLDHAMFYSMVVGHLKRIVEWTTYINLRD